MNPEEVGTLDPVKLGLEAQPKVTPATKFRRGGFKPAAEVIAEAEAAAAAGEEQEPHDEDRDIVNAAIAADPNFTFETPEGVAPLSLTQQAETGGPDETDSQLQQPTDQKYKIGGREFPTQEEAWAYAEQLEQERIAADAFRQGVEAASAAQAGNPAPQKAEPELPQEIDPLYYSDPQAYHRKLRAEIIAEAKVAVQQDLQKRDSHEQTWNQFYNDYPDLTHAREFVDLTLQQNWATLQHVETKQALKQLADKTRAKLKPYLEAQMPKVALPKVTTAASPGGAPGVTPQKSAPKTLNFAQQIKQAKKGRGAVR